MVKDIIQIFPTEPEDIRSLIIFNMVPCTSILPFSCCISTKKCFMKKQHKYLATKILDARVESDYSLPNPRSTRKSFFSSGVPGGPSKKFSGFTSPWTYLPYRHLMKFSFKTTIQDVWFYLNNRKQITL